MGFLTIQTISQFASTASAVSTALCLGSIIVCRILTAKFPISKSGSQGSIVCRLPNIFSGRPTNDFAAEFFRNQRKKSLWFERGRLRFQPPDGLIHLEVRTMFVPCQHGPHPLQYRIFRGGPALPILQNTRIMGDSGKHSSHCRPISNPCSLDRASKPRNHSLTQTKIMEKSWGCHEVFQGPVQEGNVGDPGSLH